MADRQSCKFCERSSCRNGSECKPKSQPFFKPGPALLPRSSSQVCAHYKMGTCAYGDKCAKQHPNEPQGKGAPPPVSASSSASESKKPHGAGARDTRRPARGARMKRSTVVKERDDAGGAKIAVADAGQEAEPVDDAPEVAARTPSKSICFFFLTGTCQSGDACVFAHEIPMGGDGGDDAVAGTVAHLFQSDDRPHARATDDNVYADPPASSASEVENPAVTHAPKARNGWDHAAAAADSEASDSSSSFSAQLAPLDRGADITAAGGPVADNQHIASLSEGASSTEGNMPEDEWRNDNDEDDMYAPDHHPKENEEQADDADDSADNPGDRTITFNHDQHPVSSYGNTSSDNEGGRRRSWYGDGWDQTKPASTRSSSPSSPPPPAPPMITQTYAQRIPQPMPQAAPILVMGIQPHWSQYADPLGDPQTPFCKAFAQGVCTAGAACRFRHVLTPAEYTHLFHDQQPNLWTLPTAPIAIPAAAAQLSVAPYSSPPTTNQVESPVNDVSPPVPASSALLQPPTLSGKKKPCDFYPLGKCRNGEACPYAHTQHPAPAVQQGYDHDAYHRPPPDRYDSDRGHSSGSQRPRDQFDAPCKFYTNYGNCNRGPTCKYRHGDETHADRDRDRGGYRERRRERRPADDAPPPEESSKPDAEAEDNNGWDVSNDSWANDPWGPQTTDASDWLTPDAPAANANTAADEWPPTDDNSPSAPWVVAPVPCRFFARGNCRKGEKCPDRHDEQVAPSRAEQRSRAVSEERRVGPEALPGEKVEEAGDTYNDGWSPSEKADETAAADDLRSKQQCLSFSSQGYCANMEDCPFMHGDVPENGDADQAAPAKKANWTVEDEEAEANRENDNAEAAASSGDHVDAEPEEEPIVFEHREVNRFMMQADVFFGEDLMPEKVAMLGDSRRLILSNLPLDVTPADIVGLTAQYGRTYDVVMLEETINSAVVQVDFEDSAEAYQAFRNLAGHEFRAMPISTKMLSRVMPIIRSVGQKLYAKVSWPRPTRSAWIHYPAISKAKQQVADLNGVILRGRAIKATFIAPKKAQKPPFAIHLENLDPETTRAETEEIAKDFTLVTMDPPLYEKDATDSIRFEFSGFGEMDQFDAIPVTTEAIATAFVAFKTEAAAAAAVGQLKARPLPYLGNKLLAMQGVNYARYCISRPLFETIHGELEALQEQYEKSDDCSIHHSAHPNGRSIWVRISAPFDKQHHTHFADANKNLGRLIQGSVLMSDNIPVWDDYFEISSAPKALEQIQKQTNTLIDCDHRAKRVIVYGSKTGQSQAQTLTLKLLSKVHAQRHETNLPRPKLKTLIDGGLKTLQDTIGANKVSLDVISSTLVIRGTDEDVQKAETTISLLDAGAEQDPNSRTTCQICHCEAANPVLLSCRHAYCTSCLQYMLRQKGAAPFRCISESTSSDGEITPCCAYVPFIVVEGNLPAETDQLLQESLLSYIRSQPDEYFFCPTLGCQAVHRVREMGINIKCTPCGAELCTSCKSLAHIGTACPVTN
ncbi:hypothetical protein HYPSUDRAFT_201311 [Hypholoma sublateritium FD-334 SS-4]|uniref:Uncharacterized protein n=1 Tax=Hypholoma sublateritium (strain FD-334 SS-4) TaxID=945553 RepID=A0A0D2NXX3_HYPSF|nr:hypothetical protein HYPSUDRAFT_201311 [Hypholoma sublateritium FD-334 SS-4]